MENTLNIKVLDDGSFVQVIETTNVQEVPVRREEYVRQVTQFSDKLSEAQKNLAAFDAAVEANKPVVEQPIPQELDTPIVNQDVLEQVITPTEE